MAIFDYQPMQPNTSASLYDIAYQRPREMTREDLGLLDWDALDRRIAAIWAHKPSHAPYAFWLGADAPAEVSSVPLTYAVWSSV